MSSRTNELSDLRAQLAEKNDLVAALTAQLERTATQLDRLSRSGADRPGQGISHTPSGTSLPGDAAGKLIGVLEEWQDFQPVERIERIESGIDQILELLQSQRSVTSTAAPQGQASLSHSPAEEDFWSSTKARLLAESSSESPGFSDSNVLHPAPAGHPLEESRSADSSDDLLSRIGQQPESPSPVADLQDLEELQAGVKARDVYIQYLTARLRLAETKSYFPQSWEELSNAPDDYRHRLESLELILQDHLRQAEVAHSLERALLARERAKLTQIKQNLEVQIKKMTLPATPTSPPVPVPAVTDSDHERRPDQESRWKRIFSR